MTLREETQQRFEREKQAYWAMREELLKRYSGKWVAVVNGQVVAVREERGKAMEEAYRETKSRVMFVSEVGNEERILHIRQIAVGRYDRAYDPAMPTIATLVSDPFETASDSLRKTRCGTL